MSTGAEKAGTPPAAAADPESPPGAMTPAERLASMEKLLAAFMQALDREEDAGAPHVTGPHGRCPCCSERGE